MTYSPLIKRPERVPLGPRALMKPALNRFHQPHVGGPGFGTHLPSPPQAKLIVGSPNDPLEHEADRIAADVVSGIQRSLSNRAAVPLVGPVAEEVPQYPISDAGLLSDARSLQRACTSCADQEAPMATQTRVQRNVRASTFDAPPGFIAEVQYARTRGGHSLDSGLRSTMERGFARNFVSVKFHDDVRAAELAGQVQARAFTVGNDVFFNHGEFRPHASGGQILIAHELAHVLQQGQAPQRVLRRAVSTQTEAAGSTSARTSDDKQEGHVEPSSAVRLASETVQRWLDDAIDAQSDKMRMGELLLAYFGRNDQATTTAMDGALQALRAELGHVQRLTRERRPGPGAIPTGTKLAEYQPAEPPTIPERIYLFYEGFYTEGPVRQAAVLLHEVAHHVTGVRPDIYLEGIPAATVAQLGGFDATTNSDSIVAYVMAMAGAGMQLATITREVGFKVPNGPLGAGALPVLAELARHAVLSAHAALKRHMTGTEERAPSEILKRLFRRLRQVHFPSVNAITGHEFDKRMRPITKLVNRTDRFLQKTEGFDGWVSPELEAVVAKIRLPVNLENIDHDNTPEGTAAAMLVHRLFRIPKSVAFDYLDIYMRLVPANRAAGARDRRVYQDPPMPEWQNFAEAMTREGQPPPSSGPPLK